MTFGNRSVAAGQELPNDVAKLEGLSVAGELSARSDVAWSPKMPAFVICAAVDGGSMVIAGETQEAGEALAIYRAANVQYRRVWVDRDGEDVDIANLVGLAGEEKASD
jgi:hypothetical protein